MDEDFTFPEGFLWGTATAAHQVEGDNKNSDWWHWEKSKKNIPDSGLACNHYKLYKEDFRLAKEILHNNTHRLSIEWARVEPEEGKFDQEAIKHYKDVLQELKRLDMKAMVTLHHFTNPLWFSQKGGWEKKENLKFFERYVALCVEEFGGLIDFWCIINEPNVYTSEHYIKGLRPPQKKNLLLAARVFLNLARAHRKAYEIIHRKIPRAQVGSAIGMGYLKAGSILGAFLFRPISLIVNFFFLNLTKDCYDYVGINYYFFHIIDLHDLDLLAKKIRRSALIEALYGERTDLGWPIYPEGIYEVTKDVHKRLKKPIIITENGVADKNDSKRPRFIIDHLSWLAQAIKEGVDVRGYFHWTLMDNVEWDLGRRPKFGLFRTDFKTLERIPRKSAFLYGEICKNNSITRNLLKSLDSGKGSFG